MNSLPQSEKNDILAFIGGHPESEGQEPLEQESVPRFPYSAVRDRIAGYAPPVPACYGGRDDDQSDDDQSDDDDERASDESALVAFAISKQGREYSGDVLPSARNRGAIRSELASMGCAWGE